MKENVLQVVLAILLGLALPGTIVRLMSDKPQLQQISTTAPQSSEQQQTDGMWVLTGEQKLQWMRPEEYLTGVLLAEMPTSYDHDALCAQAVAARTYAAKRSTDARHPYGAVCTDPGCCQAYVEVADYLDGLGFAEYVEIARKAVEATKDLVLTYEGSLIEATYFHSSGGRTEASVAVWGVAYPYLQPVDSPGEEVLTDHSTRIFYTREELEMLLDRQLPGNPSGWLGWTTYTVGGGVETILLAGIEYSGLQLRSLLKLNSTAFTAVAEGDGLWFITRGKGHRVGLSQLGAQAMALEGHSWQEILAHYYPGTGIDKMEVVG